VIRRSSRYDSVTTVSTNQWSVIGVNGIDTTPGIDSGGARKLSPFSPPVSSVHVKMTT
jgi:hypothetical protein